MLLRPFSALAFAGALLFVAPRLIAQTGDSSVVRSTKDGVYTSAQAQRGKDFYAAKCTGCHNTASHVGDPFTTGWRGKLVSELMSYIRENMPKDDPGTLKLDEISQVIAYLLQLNGQPEGSAELASDSVALKGIRLDFPTPAQVVGRRGAGLPVAARAHASAPTVPFQHSRNEP